MTEPALSIVLPAFNEEDRLGPALDELFAYLATTEARAAVGADWPAAVQVLIVDDGSTDGTARLVRERLEYGGGAGFATLELLSVPHAGKGSAVRAGMMAAKGRRLVFADADMATPPDQLAPLLRALESADVALGSRIQPDGSDMRASQSRLRRLLGRVFHIVAGIWVTGGIADTQCGFKGFRREAARELFARQRVTSIVFDVELIYLARRRGCSIAVVPIQWADRRGSRMHARLGLALRVAWDLFRIPILHRSLRAS